MNLGGSVNSEFFRKGRPILKEGLLNLERGLTILLVTEWLPQATAKMDTAKPACLFAVRQASACCGHDAQDRHIEAQQPLPQRDMGAVLGHCCWLLRLQVYSLHCTNTLSLKAVAKACTNIKHRHYHRKAMQSSQVASCQPQASLKGAQT